MSVHKQKNLAIYMACHHSPYAAERLPPVGDMFVELLAPVMPDWRLSVYDVVEMNYPENLDEVDAIVVTGSPASVYDDEQWIRLLHQHSREAIDKGVPFVGICFGHQLIASALDGSVKRADVGWGLGVKPVQFEPREWMNPERASLNLVHVHQDQVVRMPSGARRLAGNEFCPNAAFEIDGRALAVQGHPEFSNATLKVLSEELRERTTTEAYHDSLASTAKDNDGRIFAAWIAKFINKAQAGRVRSRATK